MEVNKRKKGIVPFLLYGKKGFAFTFLALFLAMVVLAFVHLGMFEQDFTKDATYKESRIASVDNEMEYFKQTYLPNAVSFTMYNTLDALEEFMRNDTEYAKLDQNYSKLNEYMMEGILYGSFNGTLQPTLYYKNVTLVYFLDLFEQDFSQNYKGNFTFDVLNINVYEEKPYYVTARVYANLSVTTQDNISKWDSLETIEVAVPIFDLYDPLFLIQEDEKIRLSASEMNFPIQNWTISTFEEMMNQTYSTVYIDKIHQYALGDSYLNRLLNSTSQAYKDVVAFWSFDYDSDKGEVYDTSAHVNSSILLGNARVIFDFDNSTISGLNIPDLTNYENNGTINGTDCDNLGIRDTACLFDGINDNIQITNDINITKDISVFAWIYNTGNTASGEQRIVCSANEYFCYWVNNDGTVEVRLEGANEKAPGTANKITFDEVNITKNRWHHIGFTYNGDVTYLYIDGLKYVDYSSQGGSGYYSGNLSFAAGSSYVGNRAGADRPFKGKIDELSIYSRVLADDEIAMLYKEKDSLQLDYVDSFHGKGVLFDGMNDYINLGDSSELDFNSEKITLEVWVKFSDLSHRNVIIDRGAAAGAGWGLDVDANGRVGFGLHSGQTERTNSNVINVENKWYHIVAIGGDNSETEIFVNGFRKADNGFNVTVGSALASDVIIGATSDTLSDNFEGVIDEIKIYNRTLTKDEIKNNYYNYDSLAKGCCNYITLIDPEKFGYDNLAYETNTSYSSKMFYNYHKKGIQPDIVLWEIDTITSHNIATKYFNFLLDQCMIEAFNVLDYQNQTLSVDMYKTSGVDGGSCSKLVQLGYY